MNKVARKGEIELMRKIDGRDAKVQVGNVLSELSVAYEFAIGVSYFDGNFTNLTLLTKSNS